MRINYKVFKGSTLIRELGLGELLALKGTCQFPLDLGDNLRVEILRNDIPIKGIIKSCFFNLQESSSELVERLELLGLEQVAIPCNTDLEAMTATNLFWYVKVIE